MAGSENVFVVGVEEFESSASCSRSRRATRLRYTPNKIFQYFSYIIMLFLSTENK